MWLSSVRKKEKSSNTHILVMCLDVVELGTCLNHLHLFSNPSCKQCYLCFSISKTTTMLFKMLGIERAYTLRKDIMQKPRQIFVTQSRVLAGKVEEYFSKLLDSLATAEKTKEELARLIKHKKQQQDDHEGLIDIDDDQNWRGDLPSRYSQLKDEHFPLFLTFDRVSLLLELLGSTLTFD